MSSEPAAPSASPQRTAGFRFSLVDAIAIALCAAGTFGLRDVLGEFVGILPCALGHFFLFCNVFRVRRSYELAWTAVFLVNFSAWFLAGEFSWAAVLAVQTPVTLLAIGAEVRSPRYHGIFSRRLNARLDDYLAGASFQ